MHARTRTRAHAHELFPHRSCCAAAASAAVWCVCSELATFVRPLSPGRVARVPFGSAGDAVGFRVCRQWRSHGRIMLCPFACVLSTYRTQECVPVRMGPACVAAPAVTLTSDTIKNVPLTGGASVTLVGVNFGTSDYSASSRLSSLYPCASASWVTATTVACFNMPGSRPVSAVPISMQLTVSAVVGTLRVSWASFDAPTLTGVDRPNLAVSAGASVTISGLSFGSFDETPTAAVRYNTCRTVAWTSSTLLACMMPTCYGCFLSETSDKVTGRYALSPEVTVGSIVGTGCALFSYDVPIASAVDPMNCAISGGVSVTIGGLGFGAIPFLSIACHRLALLDKRRDFPPLQVPWQTILKQRSLEAHCVLQPLGPQ
jgi:hypothetical protein